MESHKHPNSACPNLQPCSSTCGLSKGLQPSARDAHSVALPSERRNPSKSCFLPSVSMPPSGFLGLPRDPALIETIHTHSEMLKPILGVPFLAPLQHAPLPSLLVHWLPFKTGIPTSMSFSAKFLRLLTGSESRGHSPVAPAKRQGHHHLTLHIQSCPIHSTSPLTPKLFISLHLRSHCPKPGLVTSPQILATVLNRTS